MTDYTISNQKSLPYTLEIEVGFTAPSNDPLIQIPYWRPGRYQAGNFPKNFINFEAFDEEGGLISLKRSSHVWQVMAPKGTKVTLKYACYARELTAGNTYADDELILINPVNALIYVLGLEDNSSRLKLQFGNRKIATALPSIDEEPFYRKAENLQHLMDTPILIANELKTVNYQVGGVNFYMHMVGESALSEERAIRDFKAFSAAQLEAFGKFPAKEYHFLFIFLPHKAYHGVEHENSTVILLGPSTELGNRKLYKDFIGISSHELYHTWNVKYLRPGDWTPYNFTAPTFSRLGYVAEGVTTYMGDLMLWRSGAFSDEEYLEELSILINRHIANEGRFHLSLADSSVDTWVDGYSNETPRRRVSIYVEGALLSLIADLWILDLTGGEKSLSSAMKELFEQVDPHKGFSEDEFWTALRSFGDAPWENLKEDIVDGKGKLEGYLPEALNRVGLTLEKHPSADHFEGQFGFKMEQKGSDFEVVQVLMGSPAEKAGLWFGDKVISINGEKPSEFRFEDKDKVPGPATLIEVLSGFRKKEVLLNPDGNEYGKRYRVVQSRPNLIFEAWKKGEGKEEEVS